MSQNTVPGIAFVECARCKQPFSAVATQCPKCGALAAGVGRVRAPPKRRSNLIGLVALVAILGGSGYLVASHMARASLARLASVTGLPFVPWEERAQVRADEIYALKGNSLAASLLKVIHPTGQYATLVTHSTSTAQGGVLVSHFELSWRDASGGKNTTLLEWRCTQAGGSTAFVGADSALVPAQQRSVALLDEYFRTEMLPLLK